MTKGSKRKRASEAKLSPNHPSKVAYEAPRLVEYGNVTDITAGDTGSHFDPGQKNNYSKRGT